MRVYTCTQSAGVHAHVSLTLESLKVDVWLRPAIRRNIEPEHIPIISNTTYTYELV